MSFIAERNVKIDEETSYWQTKSADRITRSMVPTKWQKPFKASEVNLLTTDHEKGRLEPLLTVNKVICNLMKARGRENLDAKK